MILYNVTFILEEAIEAEWLAWMQEIHIPEVMTFNCFASSKIFKILESPNEGVTFSVQYFADDLENFETYRTNFAPQMQAAVKEKFGERLVAFRTIMELIEPK